MRVNIREAVQMSSHRYGGRDALPRDPAWHVSKLVFGFSHGRFTRVQRIWHLFAFTDMPRRIARESVPADIACLGLGGSIISPLANIL